MTPGWPVLQVETERRRLEVLAYLARIPGYEASALILKDQCRRVGVPTTSDQLLGCLSWLEEQDLITVRHENSGPVARINALGRETAEGHRIHPGILRPDP